MIGFIIIYLIYGCLTDSCRYIKNLTVLPKVFENIAYAIKSAPEVGYSIECYHYEQRVENYKDSKGNSR